MCFFKSGDRRFELATFVLTRSGSMKNDNSNSMFRLSRVGMFGVRRCWSWGRTDPLSVLDDITSPFFLRWLGCKDPALRLTFEWWVLI